MKFTPSKNYDLLKKQACSLYQIMTSHEREILFLRNKDYNLIEKKLKLEKIINDKLMNELKSVKRSNKVLLDDKIYWENKYYNSTATIQLKLF